MTSLAPLSVQGCGVVEFETAEQAQNAIQLFNGTQVWMAPALRQLASWVSVIGGVITQAPTAVSGGS